MVYVCSSSPVIPFIQLSSLTRNRFIQFNKGFRIAAEMMFISDEFWYIESFVASLQQNIVYVLVMSFAPCRYLILDELVAPADSNSDLFQYVNRKYTACMLKNIVFGGTGLFTSFQNITWKILGSPDESTQSGHQVYDFTISQTFSFLHNGFLF